MCETHGDSRDPAWQLKQTLHAPLRRHHVQRKSGLCGRIQNVVPGGVRSLTFLRSSFWSCLWKEKSVNQLFAAFPNQNCSPILNTLNDFGKRDPETYFFIRMTSVHLTWAGPTRTRPMNRLTETRFVVRRSLTGRGVLPIFRVWYFMFVVFVENINEYCQAFRQSSTYLSNCGQEEVRQVFHARLTKPVLVGMTNTLAPGIGRPRVHFAMQSQVSDAVTLCIVGESNWELSTPDRAGFPGSLVYS